MSSGCFPRASSWSLQRKNSSQKLVVNLGGGRLVKGFLTRTFTMTNMLCKGLLITCCYWCSSCFQFSLFFNILKCMFSLLQLLHWSRYPRPPSIQFTWTAYTIGMSFPFFFSPKILRRIGGGWYLFLNKNRMCGWGQAKSCLFLLFDHNVLWCWKQFSPNTALSIMKPGWRGKCSSTTGMCMN